MTSTTPKPRAGEHTPTSAELVASVLSLISEDIRVAAALDIEAAIKLRLLAERDLLRERERGLVEALAGAVRFIVRTAAHKGNMDAATLAKEEVRIMEHTSQLCSGRWTGDMVSFDLAAARALLAKHGR